MTIEASSQTMANMNGPRPPYALAAILRTLQSLPNALVETEARTNQCCQAQNEGVVIAVES